MFVISNVSRYLILAFSLLLISGLATAHELPEFTKLVEDNKQSIVNISTTQKVTRRSMLPPGIEIPENSPWGELFKRFGENGEPQEFDATSLGSGFVISEDGYILTNNHVVKDAEEIIVRFLDRKEYEAEVIGSDPRSDIALLKVDAEGLTPVHIGSSSGIKVGEWVMAIGSPFGFDHSVSVGVVSATNRSLPNETYVPFIQTDVAINPGNSGGPLFNVQGEVIGINAQIFSQTGGFMGLSFAIPVDMAMEVVEQLKQSGHVTRGWLGVYIQNVDRELAESFGLNNPKGALVSKVFPDSPASKAGLKAGDVIIKYNDTAINYSSDLPPVVGRTEIGTRSKLRVIRNGDIITRTVTIEALPRETEEAEPEQEASSHDSTLGLLVEKVPAEVRKRLELEEGGVLVREVKKGPAQQAGIGRGDIILMLNGEGVKGPSHFRELVEDLPKGRAVSVYIQRQNGQPPVYLALKLDD
ncbi:MAG: DegQ family serine endoprotease [Gammaproteobacteria bacterium]|nr:DegQ family serine endoprotease [Gammaproteobacteria bacterium]